MRVLINTLSVGHLSGRHVVYGFLRQIAKWTRNEHELVILHYASSSPPEDIAGQHITYHPVSDRAGNWAARTAWEWLELPRVVRRKRVDLVFTASGAITPGLPVPQASLAQNPWCFIPQAQRGVTQRFKARLQRRGYREALRGAAMMFFISSHLRDLYRNNANGLPETQTDIAYVGLDDSTHLAAEASRLNVEKDPLLIVSVSAMAPWKGANTLVEAIRLLRSRDIDAELRLVGPWPDRDYERHIRCQIAESGLTSAVTITGHVGREELHRHYAEAKVYCLMSCCESFGIPAAEAMAFGTPVVSTQDCAISEICSQAGLFGPVGDANWTAEALERMLVDDDLWNQSSARATENADGLRWEHCSRPFMQMFSN